MDLIATRRAAAALLAGAVLGAGGSAQAQNAVVQITVKNHRFEPAEPHAPANRPITIRVRNLDSTAMEFESVRLRVEKVVAPNTEGVINVRALSPGRYEFFDDFHKQTRGTLVVE
ncbi:MAG TPA: cupredoxin domain-containing protein [Xanthobacteraceae bacterium]|jgi:heme/copper-type cytochrome/quinol oxidase subunit 2|nr:cupredoxin domain-containing protein [Xanthobacteraceae bacterium]